MRGNEGFFEHFAVAVLTLRGSGKKVIHAGVSTGNLVEQEIKGKLCAFLVALLAERDKLLSLVHQRFVYEENDLFLWYPTVKFVRHGRRAYTKVGHESPAKSNSSCVKPFALTQPRKPSSTY